MTERNPVTRIRDEDTPRMFFLFESSDGGGSILNTCVGSDFLKKRGKKKIT